MKTKLTDHRKTTRNDYVSVADGGEPVHEGCLGEVVIREKTPMALIRISAIRRRPRRVSEANVSPESGEASAARTAASAGAATRASWLLDRARDADVILKRIRKIPAGGADSEWLKRAATETLHKRGPNGTSGALGQFRGHLFEHLDVRDYNLRNVRARRVLTLRTKAHAPGYDASRFIGGRFAGGVQHKLSASGVIRAVEKLNARKAGSATRATLRVPKDQAAHATRRVAGRMRVEASSISTSTIKRNGDAGLRRLASRGSAATSSVNQFTRGTGFSALSGVVLGSLGDARKLYRREMSAHEFAARRGMDASEGAIGNAASIAATAGVAAGLNTLAAGTGTTAAVAGTVVASKIMLPLAVGVATVAGVGYALRPVRRRAQVWAAARAKRTTCPEDANRAPDHPAQAQAIVTAAVRHRR